MQPPQSPLDFASNDAQQLVKLLDSTLGADDILELLSACLGPEDKVFVAETTGPIAVHASS